MAWRNSGKPELGPPVAWQIVGIIGDVKVSGLGEKEPSPELYVPYAQSPWPSACVVVQNAANPLAIVNSVKNAIREIDKDQPITNIKSMDQIVVESVSQPRFRTWLLGAFALVALVLAAVGIYGVMSYSVTQRTSEIGIRVALGAQRGDVLRLVVRQGMTLALLGVGIGLLGAFALTRALKSLLFEVSVLDPVALAVACVLMTLVGMLAALIPASRAARVDPTTALRDEG
jgi:putative ABC transport system permease protein